MIRLRPEAEGDEGFLFAVYASTREWEMAAIPFTPEQRQSFLEMQFRAQRLHYAKHYAEASSDVVLFEDEPAGRLCVLRTATDISVVDIAILSRFRGKGIGSVLLRQIFAEAAAEGKTVSGHVEYHNPALELWKRLGFEVVEDLGVFVKVLWRPPQMAGATPQMHR